MDSMDVWSGAGSEAWPTVDVHAPGFRAHSRNSERSTMPRSLIGILIAIILVIVIIQLI